MADDDHREVAVDHELLEQVEPVDVEVVRRLVEQVGVVAGEQQRCQPDPCRLAPGQRRHLLVVVDREADVAHDDADAVVEVGGTEGEPVVQGGGVGVLGSCCAGCQCVGGVVQRRLGGGHARAPGELLADGLVRSPVGLLGEVAEVGG